MIVRVKHRRSTSINTSYPPMGGAPIRFKRRRTNRRRCVDMMHLQMATQPDACVRTTHLDRSCSPIMTCSSAQRARRVMIAMTRLLRVVLISSDGTGGPEDALRQPNDLLLRSWVEGCRSHPPCVAQDPGRARTASEEPRCDRSHRSSPAPAPTRNRFSPSPRGGESVHADQVRPDGGRAPYQFGAESRRGGRSPPRWDHLDRHLRPRLADRHLARSTCHSIGS